MTSIADRLTVLLIEAQSKATEMDAQAAMLANEAEQVYVEWQAAEMAVRAGKSTVEKKRSARAKVEQEQERLLAELRSACQRLGIRGIDAT
jgi:hypothetical protein